MKYIKLLFVAVGLLISIVCPAQNDIHLKKLKEGVVKIRQSKSSKAILNSIVSLWSAADSPKITLMDEIGEDKHEYWDKNANKFQINKVVAYVYGNQNTGMVSKGEYFNSTEKDVFYSAIEKNVMKGEKVSYTITGHMGSQEFIFISYNPRTPFTVIVNGKQAAQIGDGVQYIGLSNVREDDEIVFSIKNESSTNESFVILNHNPQK